MPISLTNIGVTEPHIEQKERVPTSVVNVAIASCPDTQRKPVKGAATKVANGAPWCLRHLEQWQFTIMENGPSTSYRTAPHKHCPLLLMFPHFGSAASALRRAASNSSPGFHTGIASACAMSHAEYKPTW